MPIGDHCRREPLTVGAKQSARDAARLMKQKNSGSLVVVDRDHPIGMLTDRDLALGLIAKRRDPERTSVRELMSHPVVTIPESAPASQAARMMQRNALRRLPVVDARGRLVGVVTSDDVLVRVADELAALRDTLEAQNPQHTAVPAARP